MKKFRFSASVTVSAYTDVIAETEEEARKIAEEREVAIRDNYYTARTFWVIEEPDGIPQDITVTGSEDASAEDADEE